MHELLVSEGTFERGQELLSVQGRRAVARTVRPTDRPYLLRGILRCGICRWRMQGTWNHDRPHYRCVARSDYALEGEEAHPKTVYLREDAVVGPLDDWLAQVFALDRISETIRQLKNAQFDDRDKAAVEAARRAIADCDQRMDRYRAAVKAGTDPALIARWTAEVSAKNLKAETTLAED